VDRANEAQKRVPVAKLRALMPELSGRTVAIWGLAFKAQTDDMRESAALVVVAELAAAGARVVAHDPKALAEARRRFGDRITYAEHRYDAVTGADALLVLTEWQEYRVLDLAEVKRRMRRPVIVDARNLYDPARMREAGFTYASIGRP
jgi:UDPglucose 6-dehydrogenase